jgi:hypothetical protein
MVAWESISRPLGVKDLRLQVLTLRARWEWLKRTDSNKPCTVFMTMLCNGSFIVVCSSVELNEKHKTLIEGKHHTKTLNFCRDRERAHFSTAAAAIF